jgi:hypothetical protein
VERKLVILGGLLIAFPVFLGVVYWGAKVSAASSVASEIGLKGTLQDPDVVKARAELEKAIAGFEKELAELNGKVAKLRGVPPEESPEEIKKGHAELQANDERHQEAFRQRFGGGR